jgi:hypothetical protein
MSSPISYDLQGQGGGIVMDNSTGSINANFRWIQVINDTVLASIASNNITSASVLSGITIPAGVGIGGNFTQIEVTSGVVIAYYK